MLPKKSKQTITDVLIPPDKIAITKAYKLVIDKDIRLVDLANVITKDPVLVLEILKAGNQNIVTVDEVNAKAVGVSVHELAYTWANGTRVALGAKPLRKDYADVSRGYMGRESRYLGNTMTGMASWYGPTFHGKRAADGSRFNTDEYTAAHRTYPFGTLVKVTNLRTHKSCVVKISDLGPYTHGRIIDLSKKAAEDIGMLGSGVAKVKLEVVGQY